MKIILDEGVPEGLCAYLRGHNIQTVNKLGWKGTKNGRLLERLESASAEVFITADKSLDKQQLLAGRCFATLVLSTNSWPLIQNHISAVEAAMKDTRPGAVLKVECGTFVPRRFRSIKDQ